LFFEIKFKSLASFCSLTVTRFQFSHFKLTNMRNFTYGNFQVFLRIFLLLIFVSGVERAYTQQNVKLSPALISSFKARHIGPAVMSGRIAALDAVDSRPVLLYVGAAGGGVWKSANG
jgi:hypothetical protein